MPIPYANVIQIKILKNVYSNYRSSLESLETQNEGSLFNSL